jgi:hypothetical protein
MGMTPYPGDACPCDGVDIDRLRIDGGSTIDGVCGGR